MAPIAVSTGSACAMANPEPSHVLKAMGLGDQRAYSSVRFSLGRFTTRREIEVTLQKVVKSVKFLRSLSPLYEMAKKHKLSESVM